MLTSNHPYGEHIDLTCRNHPNLKWSTKNIAPIGCRGIFFDLRRECKEPECDCKLSDLIVVDRDK